MSSKNVVASAERAAADAGNDVFVAAEDVGAEEEWPALSSGSSGKGTVLVSGDATGEAAGEATGDASADAQGVGKTASSSSLAEPGGDGAETEAGGEGKDMRAAWLK